MDDRLMWKVAVTRGEPMTYVVWLYYSRINGARRSDRYRVDLACGGVSTPIYRHECLDFFEALDIYLKTGFDLDFQSYMDGVYGHRD